MTARIRIVIVVVGIAIGIFGAAALRVVWQGRAALADGDQAQASGDTIAAIDHWRAAARSYLPLAPHVGDAYDRLARTARAADAAPDPVTALAAWRAIRSASRATSGPGTAAELAAEADRRIAVLMAADPDGSPGAGDTATAREAWHSARLAAVPGPSLAMAVIAGLGLLAWIAGLVVLAARGFTGGRLNRRRAAVAVAVAVAGAATWSIGLIAA